MEIYWGWAVVDALAFFAALALSALVPLVMGVELPKQAAEFWFTGVPTWLAGISTLAAVYYARLAFVTWREQDDSKRKAVFGERLLLATFEAAKAIRSARFIMEYNKEFELASLLDWVVKDAKPKKEALGPVEELRTLIPIVKHYFGKDIANEVIALTEIGTLLAKAYGLLDILNRQVVDGVPALGKNIWPGDLETWKEQVINNLAVVGLHEKGSRKVISMLQRDALDDIITKHATDIENAVAPCIVEPNRN